MVNSETSFLTREELKQISEYSQPSRQREWLQKVGVRFIVSRTGLPLVSREWLEETAGAGSKKKIEPSIDLDALNSI